MQYVPIGEFVTFENEVFRCVKYVQGGTDCNMCDFDDNSNCSKYLCTGEMCDDFTEVMFILFDNTSEDDQDAM